MTTMRRQAIREGYENNESPKVIAKRLGCSEASVKVTASRMGITRSHKEASDFRRGFTVPEDMQEDYRLLVKSKGIPARESARILGLLPEVT